MESTTVLQDIGKLPAGVPAHAVFKSTKVAFDSQSLEAGTWVIISTHVILHIFLDDR